MEKNKIVSKRIKKIRVKPNQDVYDIKTEKNHNFFANDLCVHNCDYRGELMIILHNLSDKSFIVNHGDRIAQCVINKFEHADFNEVEEFPQNILKNDRGGGFGSTGIK